MKRFFFRSNNHSQGRQAGRYNPIEEDDKKEKEALMLVVNAQASAEEQAKNQQLTTDVAHLVKISGPNAAYTLDQKNRAYLKIRSEVTDGIVDALQTALCIAQVECVGLSEKEMLKFFEAVKNNQHVTGFHFIGCPFTFNVRNLFDFYFSDRQVDFFSLIDSGLTAVESDFILGLADKFNAVEKFVFSGPIYLSEQKLLLENLSKDKLFAIGLHQHDIEHLKVTFAKAPKLVNLSFFGAVMLTPDNLELLVGFILDKNIKQLNFEKLTFSDEQAYKSFIKFLRENTSLRSIAFDQPVDILKDCVKSHNFEADIAVQLIAKNTTLENVSYAFSASSQSAPFNEASLARRSTIKKLLTRNQYLNRARDLIEKIDPSSVSLHEIFSIINNIIPVRDFLREAVDASGGYISNAHEEVAHLSRELDIYVINLFQRIPDKTWHILNTLNTRVEQMNTPRQRSQKEQVMRIMTRIADDYMDSPSSALDVMRGMGETVPAWVHAIVTSVKGPISITAAPS